MVSRDKEGIGTLLREIREKAAFTRRETGREALDQRVMAAIAKVPREQFVPESGRMLAFRDGPLPIGHGQTISQPFMVALMTDLLQTHADSVILEVGTGSGYQAAVLAEIVQHVYSIEVLAPLAESARQRLAALGYANVTVRSSDGFAGWPEQAPFDGIIVTAAAPVVPPPLIDQLKPGARLVIPVGPAGGFQWLCLVEKRMDGSVDSRNVLPVSFVPLTRALP